MSFNSNFLSDFGGNLSSIDILTSVSSSSKLTTNLLGTYYGRYFEIGNLLIQFTDFSTGFPEISENGFIYYVNFPKAYSSKPYSIMATSCNTGESAFLTVTNYSTTSFDVHIGNYPTAVSFIAIGPK